ncbi:hypothetical protein ACQP2P_36405 [Dactylosporangium sp. CA-139114]|uniref:hypothetical protein n=1 Tax=Dactylosporangium sp. CA-139114 TaxID=3239931 RepID=UPI003D994E40
MTLYVDPDDPTAGVTRGGLLTEGRWVFRAIALKYLGFALAVLAFLARGVAVAQRRIG